MNKIISQVVLIVVSAGLFLTVIDPLYRSEDLKKPGIKKLQADIAQYDEAINKSEEFVREKNKLLDLRNRINDEDRNRLERLLPDSIDNIRLVIDINNIARPYGFVLKNLRCAGGETVKTGTTATTPQNNKPADASQREIAIGGNETIGSVTLGFSINTRYQTFKDFLHSLESSLRLADVTNISIRNTSGDFYDFDITIKTYWLR